MTVPAPRSLAGKVPGTPVVPLRIGVFPSLSGRDPWSLLGNGHMREVRGDWEASGFAVTGLSPDIWLSRSATDLPPLDVVHVNWTETAAMALSRGAGRLRRFVLRLPRLSEAYGMRRMAAVIAAFRSRDAAVIYQAHDLASNWLPAGTVSFRLDLGMKRALLRHSTAWVIHESSCLEPLSEEAKAPAHLACCPLGDFTAFHGPPLPAAGARARLGLPVGARIFLASGTDRGRRDPRGLTGAFLAMAPSDWRLIVIGKDLPPYEGKADSRLDWRAGFLANEVYRDLYCAADWVVMDAARYLTSAVVRTALSYGRPVICRRFGSQADMAEGAAVWIEGDDPEALGRALARPAAIGAEEYGALSYAAERNSENRTWAHAHAAYRELLTAVRRTPDQTRAP